MPECEQLPCLETKALVFDILDPGSVLLTGKPNQDQLDLLSLSPAVHSTIHALLATNKTQKKTLFEPAVSVSTI